MNFKVTAGAGNPYGKNTIFLIIDNWDDYHYKTSFNLVYCDKNGFNRNLGTIKIGKKGMKERDRISDFLENEFDSLSDDYFSMLQTAEWSCVKI